MATSAVLLGYGLFDPGKANYRDYVESFARVVNGNNVGRVVLCGGRTDPTRPSVSEAASIYSYLKPMLKEGIEVLMEEKSLTSYQNIEFSKDKVDMDGDAFVFCGNAKLPKVAWYVMHYWFGMGRGEIARELLRQLRAHDGERMTTEQIGKAMANGMTIRNVTFKPYRMWTDADDMLGNMMSSLVEIEVLYDRGLYDEFIAHAREKFGLASQP